VNICIITTHPFTAFSVRDLVRCKCFKHSKKKKMEIINTAVLGEANGQRRRSNFLDKQVFLVEEENDGGVREPLIIAD